MLQLKTIIPEKVRKLTDRRAFPVAITVLQIVAATFFAVDAIEDYLVEAKHGFSLATAIEFFIAVVLLGGIFLSSRYVVHLTRELRWNEHSLARAKGALMDHMTVRFQKWGLTPGEGDVALFALKGCDIAKIAELRGVATGTVRAQLSQIYSKAGVTSQAMLVSLFIEDLLDDPIRP